MRLEELVPKIELCKLIPDGEFADSAFYWFQELQHINEKPPHDYRYFVSFADFRGYAWGGGRCCPAPTVQEIIEDIPDYVLSAEAGEHLCDVYLSGGDYAYGKTAVEAALKLWLKLKGVQDVFYSDK